MDRRRRLVENSCAAEISFVSTILTSKQHLWRLEALLAAAEVGAEVVLAPGPVLVLDRYILQVCHSRIVFLVNAYHIYFRIISCKKFLKKLTILVKYMMLIFVRLERIILSIFYSKCTFQSWICRNLRNREKREKKNRKIEVKRWEYSQFSDDFDNNDFFIQRLKSILPITVMDLNDWPRSLLVFTTDRDHWRFVYHLVILLVNAHRQYLVILRWGLSGNLYVLKKYWTAEERVHTSLYMDSPWILRLNTLSLPGLFGSIIFSS